jgi:hypothetical protein
MYGPTHEDGYWRIKVNKEIYNIFKYLDIVLFNNNNNNNNNNDDDNGDGNC